MFNKNKQKKKEVLRPTEKATRNSILLLTKNQNIEQEKEEGRKRAPTFSGNADLWQWEQKECLKHGRKLREWRNLVF